MQGARWPHARICNPDLNVSIFRHGLSREKSRKALLSALLKWTCEQNQMWRHCPLSDTLALHGIASTDKVTANVDENKSLADKLARLPCIETNLTAESSIHSD